MKDDDHRPDKTNCTTELSQDPQSLVQEVCAENSAYQYAQCAQRSDENRRRKSVRRKIEDLSHAECYYAGPPQRCLEIRKPLSFEAMLGGSIVEALLGYYETGSNHHRSRNGEGQPYVSIIWVLADTTGHSADRVAYLSSSMLNMFALFWSRALLDPVRLNAQGTDVVLQVVAKGLCRRCPGTKAIGVGQAECLNAVNRTNSLMRQMGGVAQAVLRE